MGSKRSVSALFRTSLVKLTRSPVKSFPTLTEAEAFIKGAGSSATKPSKSSKFYGVAIGHLPGVYTDYANVEAQTRNCPGAKQRSFASRAEAQAFVNEFRRDASAPISLRGDLSEASSVAASKGVKVGETASKKQRKNDAVGPTLTNGDIKLEPGTGPLPEGAEDGFDPTIKLDLETGSIRIKTEEELSGRKLQPTGDFSGIIHVYTDGSSLGNGQVGAVGGVGVYFGPQDDRSVFAVVYAFSTNGMNRNISEPLRGTRQTNQRAELTAIARALDHVPIDRSVLIHTDSNYSIKCIEDWSRKWVDNNWKNSSGKDVENRDLIEPIKARISERNMCGAETNFKWIKGHANDPGNTAADLLAVQGSRYSTPELRNMDMKTISATLNTPTTPHNKKQPAARRFVEPPGNPKMKVEPAEDSKTALTSEEEFEEIFAGLAAEQRSAQVYDPSSTTTNHVAESDAYGAQE
jgi:ribonuclease HI